MATSIVSDEELKSIRDEIAAKSPNRKVRAWQIKDEIKSKHNQTIDESTIRGRFLIMKEPLSGGIAPSPGSSPYPRAAANAGNAPKAEVKEWAEPEIPEFNVPDELTKYIPPESNFDGYIERGIDKRLSLHYDTGKFPLTQGKQGTGKTFSHEFYAWRRKLPFLLISCYEDFKLPKIFGDKTIENGSVVFKESLFTQFIQNPSVILFDEVNAISNQNTFDFHALIQNRELFVKDADNGNGKMYKIHEHCKIGFAQNPKSAKYIGGNIKPSNFLGRLTYITYPEFSKIDIRKAIAKRFPSLSADEVKNFTVFYFSCIKSIETGNIPVDISIRQIFNVIDLYTAGLPLKESIEDGLTSIMEAVSQPQNKDAFWRIAQANWQELLDEKQVESISKQRGFTQVWRLW